MTKAYWIVRVSVHNAERYPEYLEAARPAFEKFGARHIVRGGRYEAMEGETVFSAGGLCRIKGKQVIIINKRAEKKEKIQTLVRALRRFDVGHLYLKPALRDLLESLEEEIE